MEVKDSERTSKAERKRKQANQRKRSENLQKDREQIEVDVAAQLTALTQAYQIHNSVSNVIPDISGTWNGQSGEMIIVVEGKNIKGDYDYAGFTKVGHIEGTFDGQVIIYKWWWDRSSEKGNGFFFYDKNAQKLKGSWFLNYQRINLPDDFNILTGDMMSPWCFTGFRPTI